MSRWSVRPLLALAVGVLLGGCAQILGVDGLTYVGQDASLEGGAPDVVVEAEVDAPEADVASTCDGPCPPRLVVSATGLEPTLATNGTTLYLRAGAEIESCPVDGCVAPAHVFTANTASGLVAASSTYVYWSDGSAVYGCAAGDACTTPTTMMDLQPLGIVGLSASTASNWVLASGSSASTLRVLRAALDGSAQDQVIAQSIGGGAAGAVAAVPKSAHVYWALEGTPTIFDCVTPPCAATDHNTNALGLSPLGLVATHASVFFGTSGGLDVAPADLSSAAHFAATGAVTSVVLRPSSEAIVYFVEHAGANWAVESCPTVGACKPATLHATTTAIGALAADDASLVWIEGDAVMRMVLP